jgi:hypothetical protein
VSRRDLPDDVVFRMRETNKKAAKRRRERIRQEDRDVEDREHDFQGKNDKLRIVMSSLKMEIIHLKQSIRNKAAHIN